MKTYIGGHQAVTTDDFLELALGTPLELWLGVLGESEEERAARLDAARDILADRPGLYDTVTRVAAELTTAPSLALLQAMAPVRFAKGQGRASRKAAA
ncbi:hypothetical protein QZH56_03475 [Streptomyces olivoreticuli]|uniref:hypothetical protein n=1 Tax=Streptomyces olivoreticuli TaxID=68246 RepID=UPI002657C164|nr:hypothetical protein [Streptomyces olivoreticuli]WKK24707.1 hypothetical protein QZH56_03475 [Streptomyces olivoreticuli]